MSVPWPPPERVTLPPWLVTVISPSIRNTPYCPSMRAAPEFGAAHADRGERRRNENVLVLERLHAAGGKKERPRCRFQRGLADAAFRFVNVAFDDEARVLAERQHRVVAKGDLQPRIGPGAELFLHAHFHADHGGCWSRCRDHLRRVLDLVDAADRIGALRSRRSGKVRGEKQPQHGPKTEARGKEAARRRFNALAEPSHRLEVTGRAGWRGERFIITEIRRSGTRVAPGRLLGVAAGESAVL